MIITKNRLAAEDVRQLTEEILRKQLHVSVKGYKCTSEMVCNVLMKAAVEGMSVESVCGDLQGMTGSNTIREHLNAILDVCALREHECEMNAALVSCIPRELPRVGREMAIDYHDRFTAKRQNCAVIPAVAPPKREPRTFTGWRVCM